METVDRDSFSRWRDRQYFGPRRWLENALREPWSTSDAGEGGRNGSKTSQNQLDSSGSYNLASQSNPIWLSDEIEYWPETPKNTKFVAIASLHSELVAVSANGTLYQWKWIEVEPYRNLEVSLSKK